MENVELIVLLLFGVTFLAVLSNKYRFPFPILLVVCGVLISLIPHVPVVMLKQEIVFFIFLPPLLYEAAWKTSWHEFKSAIRPISLAAIGLVFFTTTLVAITAYYLIPGLTWAIAFLIGAIVSPPDAVAATSVLRGLGLPPRLIAILEGESLVNDASGLIAYKYALAAVFAGHFVFWEAAGHFIFAASAGIALGLLIGYLMYLVHKKFICDPVIEVTLTFLTPFASYLIAEEFHLSGVLAVVSTGLYLSFRSARMFSHQSRIMAYAVWDVTIFVLNGIIFLLIGLQLRSVIAGITGYPTGELILYGVVISLVVIVVRFIWVVPSALLPRILSKRIREREKFDPRHMVVFGWAGMRGVVSMAAAMAIPMTMYGGVDFPQRNLVVFLTFCVVLSTLILLGFSLRTTIRKLGLQPYSLVTEEYEVRNHVVSRAIDHIEEHLSLVPDELLNNIKSKYEVKYNRLQKTDLPSNYFGNGKTLAGDIFNQFSQMQIDLISVERDALEHLHRDGKASEEIIRKLEHELDLEETRLNMEMYRS